MKPVKMIVAGSANPHVMGYLRGLESNLPYVEILAVADPDPTRLAAVRALLGANSSIRLHTDVAEMFDAHPQAEAVMVGSDNSDHYAMCAEALRRGLHVYCMKVVSMDEEECAALEKLQQTSGRIFQVEFELHFSPQFIHARQLVQSGALGTIRSVYFSNISQCPICYYPNWGVPELSYGKRVPLRPGANVYRGGALTDHPHPFDLLRWILGTEFASVRALSARNQRDYLEVEDHIVLTGEMSDGVKYMINPSYSNLEERGETRRLFWPKSLECNLKIMGDDGYYAADYFDHPLYVLGQDLASPNRLIVEGVPRRGAESLLQSFATAVRGERTKVESSLSDGIAAVKVMNAAYESVYQNAPVVFGSEVPAVTGRD